LQAGITYVAQVLKRNRTLKILNLSENKLEVTGLVAIAEALVRLRTFVCGRADCVAQKYNTCLETLDLSKNPCCGPGLDGVCVICSLTIDPIRRRILGSVPAYSIHPQYSAEAIVLVINGPCVSGGHRIGRISSRISFIASS